MKNVLKIIKDKWITYLTLFISILFLNKVVNPEIFNKFTILTNIMYISIIIIILFFILFYVKNIEDK